MSDKPNTEHLNKFNYEKVKTKRDTTSYVIVIILLATFGVFILFYMFKDEILEDLFNDSSIIVKNDETVIERDFASGLRLASLGKYDEAIKHFEKIKFESLSDGDKYIVLDTYLQANQDQKALDLNLEFDEEIIRKYLSNGELELLKKLKTKSELIEFEVAVLNNDYEKIILLKDADRLEKDVRRANAIANAYYQLGEIDKAVNFTSLMVHDGVNMWELEGRAEVSKIPQIAQTKPNKNMESSSGVFGIIIILIGLLGVCTLGFFIYKVYKKKRKYEEDNNDNHIYDDVNDNGYENDNNSVGNGVVNTDEDRQENDKYSYYYED